MRRLAVLLLILFQLVVLAYMAGNREYIVRYGRTVYLRTAPIDPRDLFRGDFVRLDYELSQVDATLADLPEKKVKKGHKVYARLSPIAGDLYGITRLTDSEPDEGLYMRGRVLSHSPAHSVRVKYGIEQYFVEQGAGIDIEKRRGKRQGLQVPMEVAVALSANGTAVIRDFRWSKLGMQLEVTRTPPRRDRSTNLDELEGPLSPKLKLTMKNVSDKPLALVNPGDNCGFELVAVVSNRNDFVSADQSCVEMAATDADVVNLAPDEEHSVGIDLSETRWHVQNKGRVDEMGRLAGWDRFRIVYRAPDTLSAAQLSAQQVIWPGYLPSRAFRATGQID